MSLRFNMSGVNLDTFGEWLMQIDPDSGISSFFKNEKGHIFLTTAHTWEEKDWKLRPYFEKGIEKDLIKYEDAEYFQVFSIPGQNNSLAFNCPRIYSKEPLSPFNMWDVSYAYTTGRKQIRRIAAFCQKYFKGFENAYISNIAHQLGIRDSRRIEGNYCLSKQDILQAKKFKNPVAKSNYPIDVHAQKGEKNKLTFLKDNEFYEIPLESLIPKSIENLLVVGKTISCEFDAQASLRIQPNCWSIGENAGKYVSKKVMEKS